MRSEDVYEAQARSGACGAGVRGGAEERHTGTSGQKLAGTVGLFYLQDKCAHPWNLVVLPLLLFIPILRSHSARTAVVGLLSQARALLAPVNRQGLIMLPGWPQTPDVKGSTHFSLPKPKRYPAVS
ncbi:hypothetical protein AAY473_039463 [Plecturocebus cupreus]